VEKALLSQDALVLSVAGKSEVSKGQDSGRKGVQEKVHRAVGHSRAEAAWYERQGRPVP
jgi:hypothetical protein